MWWLVVLLVCGVCGSELLPAVVWWTELLYPHPDGGAEITCPGGGRCASRRRGSAEGPAAFLFYGTDFRGDDLPLPRREGELWCLLHEESPMNNFVLPHAVGLFNLTATFSRNAHFPLPTLHLPSLHYLTRRAPLPTGEKNRLRQQGLAPVLYLQSHCGVSSDRDRYVRRLMQFIPVDAYGGCLHNGPPLPPHLRTTDAHNSPLLMDFIARYKFHLAFENAICEDYVTEKLFRALHVGSVPVYRGSPSVLDWAPSTTSLVMVDHFPGPRELARFIQELDEDDARYDAYLTWKVEGVSNEFLKKTLEDRTWSVDDPTDTGQVHDPGTMDFIRGFECYVCDQLCGKIPRPPPANQRHMNCPPPHPSLPPEDLEDLPEEVDSCRLHEDERSCPLLEPLTDHHETSLMRWSVDDWLRDHQFASQQAKAIALMLHSGEKDSSRFLHYLDRVSSQ